MCTRKTGLRLIVVAALMVVVQGEIAAGDVPAVIHRIEMPSDWYWAEMQGLAWNPADTSHIYVSCDNAEHIHDIIAKIDLAGVEEARQPNHSAKGATFTDGYVWTVDADGGVRRYSADLSSPGVLYPCDISWGITWDSDASCFWGSKWTPSGGSVAAYTRNDGGQTLDKIVGSDITLDFFGIDLSYKDGFLWIGDQTNNLIKKIETSPGSATVLETWRMPKDIEGIVGGLTWGSYGGFDVLWCATVNPGHAIYALVPPGLVPAVRVWGLVAMALLVLTAATVVIMRRRAMVHGGS